MSRGPFLFALNTYPTRNAVLELCEIRGAIFDIDGFCFGPFPTRKARETGHGVRSSMVRVAGCDSVDAGSSPVVHPSPAVSGTLDNVPDRLGNGSAGHE